MGVSSVQELCQVLRVRNEALSEILAAHKDAREFFAPHGPYKGIVELAYRLPKLVQHLPLLEARVDASVVLTQLQCASLLANGFLCQFPLPKGRYGGMNFDQCFEKRNVEKLRCLLHYFRRVHERNFTENGLIRIHRRYLRSMPVWENSQVPLFDKSSILATAAGTIEDASTEEYIHADFANKIPGGGVIGHGLVQEEIRFLICPELIVSRLLCEELSDQEVLILEGVERFSNYSGYGYGSFCWTGDHIDVSPFQGSMRCTKIVAFDAMAYKKHFTHVQFQSAAYTRELNKAYCAFFRETDSPEDVGICTGNWGAGVFLGDPYLKYLVQVMAAAMAGHRSLLYNTWGDAQLAQELNKLKSMLEPIGFTIGELIQCIESFDCRNTAGVSLFDHIVSSATS